jgi:hypothetical protein
MDYSDPIAPETVAPNSYLFLLVANIGPGESHRPVAVALVQGNLSFGVHGSDVIQYCVQTIDILSDPGNQIAIRTDLALATDFYKNDKREDLLPRVRLPQLTQPYHGPKVDTNFIREWDQSISPFPFTATCLQLGIGYNPAIDSEAPVRKEALGTVFHDDSLEHGMVVIDISDLDDIHHGFFGISIRAALKEFGSAE